MSSEFLAKAHENLQAAQICFDHGLYNACANRTYYASLQAAIAALEHKNIRREKIDHKCIQADFSEKLITRQKVYPAKFESYLPDMQMVRNIADYTDTHVSKRQAHLWLTRAKELIDMVNSKK